LSASLNIGIIGFGMSARVFHAPFLINNPKYKWTAVVERTSNNAVAFYPPVKTYRTADEIFNDASVDIIVITTPNETHFPYAKQALLCGKHAVVEKPFTITTAEAKELIELSHQTKKILSVYHNRRYVSDFLTIKEILEKKLLGDIAEFESHFDRFRPDAKPNAWREKPSPGSGVLYDLGPHLIDQALYLFGLPKFITADIKMQRPHAVADDYFDIRLDYDFTKVILHAGMLVREPGPRYMIHGTNGSFIKYGDDPQETALKNGAMPNTPNWGMEDEKDYGLLHTGLDGKIIKEKIKSAAGNFGMYYDNLYDSIINNVPLKEKPEHGYNTIRIIELAFKSSQLKKTLPVTGLINVPYY
jgi:scyllo-inositol 2-dehydrogenase (NADP+)